MYNMKIKNLNSICYELGKIAFQKRHDRKPLFDRKLMEVLIDSETKKHSIYFKQWLVGYDDAKIKNEILGRRVLKWKLKQKIIMFIFIIVII